jgi:hypothetical protein
LRAGGPFGFGHCFGSVTGRFRACALAKTSPKAKNPRPLCNLISADAAEPERGDGPWQGVVVDGFILNCDNQETKDGKRNRIAAMLTNFEFHFFFKIAIGL